MTAIPTTRDILEMVEDMLEAATGEPREVTNIQFKCVPEQSEQNNWSVDATCEPAYDSKLDAVIEEVMAKHPVIAFGEV